MANYTQEVPNYRAALALARSLGRGPHCSMIAREIGHATYIEWEDPTALHTDNICLRYYDTRIVTYHPDGTATFFLGKYKNSNSTKERIREIVLPGNTWQLVASLGLKWIHSPIYSYTSKRYTKENQHLLTEYEFRDHDRICVDHLREDYYRPIIWDRYEG